MWSLIGEGIPETRLVGPRVLLRPPIRADAAAWAELRRISRDFLEPWEPSWAIDAATRAEFHRRRQRYVDEWRSRAGYAFLIFHRDRGDLLGGIGLSNVRRGVADMASLGYWTGKPHARQGYMTEAVACAVAYALDTLGLHRVEAACLPENAASQGLLRKCGFHEEGMARGYLKIDGRWRDHLTFAVLNTDPR